MIIGNIHDKWNKGCYIASFKETVQDDYGNEINRYYEPEFYRFNVQPASGSTDIAIYGENVSKMYKTVVSMKEYDGVFKEGDKAYLEGLEPIMEVEDTYGINANYKIVSVRPQNTVILIYFEKI